MPIKGGASISTRDGLIRVFCLLLVFSAYINVNYTFQSSILIPATLPPVPIVDCSFSSPSKQTQRQAQEDVTTKTTAPIIAVASTIAPLETSPGTIPISRAATASSKPASTTTRTKSRILVGYFAYGITGQGRTVKRRQKMRQYFNLIQDKRICTLNELLYGKRVRKQKEWLTVNGDDCQFIYTFVSGFVADENDTNATKLPTELLADNVPIDNLDAYRERVASHQNDIDVTFLNIEENMNTGKSQTWFKYAAQVMDRLDIDYAIKTDTDCLIVMDHFFNFIDTYLPPHGNLYYAGRLSDKAFWRGSQQFNTKDGSTTVNALRRRAMVAIYMAGELYILSKDLAHWVSSESFVDQPWYEQIEDHDVGMRVFDYPQPLQVVRVSYDQQFWVHPAKDHQTWKLFMNRESRRKSGVDYIGDGSNTNSTAAAEFASLPLRFQSLLRATNQG